MPTIPKVRAITNNSADVLNAIRNEASQNYQNYVPYATPDAAVIRSIGAVLMDFPALRNEFINILVNRIARVIVTSKMYSNPWSFLKKGELEYGETVEEIFVNIAKAQQFDQEVAETEVFKRELPDVRAAFHAMNFQKFYKVTISEPMLKQAFVSVDGVQDLIARVVNSLYSGANYDEFLVMKYLLALHILRGHLNPVKIDTPTQDNAREVTTTILGESNALTFMTSENNMAGVETFTDKNDQYLILNSRFAALMNVNVDATSFNQDYVQFMGRTILVDSFGSLDIARLNLLLADNPGYEELSAADLQLLDNVPGVLVDRSFFMIFDNYQYYTENYNGQGLYWNEFWHVGKTFSVSPYSNAVVFTPVTPAVIAVSVVPATLTLTAGQTYGLTANVTAAGFARQGVNWSVDSDDASIDDKGNITISSSAASGTSITVTATSVYTTTVTGKATITVA